MRTQPTDTTTTLDPRTLALARCYRLLVAEWQKYQNNPLADQQNEMEHDNRAENALESEVPDVNASEPIPMLRDQP